MTQEDNIIVPRWFLENVEDTLRIQNNINLDEKTGETCQDRNVRESLNGLRKLLKGEELTGMERLEKLQPSLPSKLDKVAEEYANTHYGEFFEVEYEFGDPIETIIDDKPFVYGAFKAGAEWMAGQGINIESNVVLTQEEDTCRPYLALQDFGYMPAPKFCKESDKVIIQIRKK